MRLLRLLLLLLLLLLSRHLLLLLRHMLLQQHGLLLLVDLADVLVYPRPHLLRLLAPTSHDELLRSSDGQHVQLHARHPSSRPRAVDHHLLA